MHAGARLAAVAVAVAIAGAAWMARYAVVSDLSGNVVIVLDRWAGKVYRCEFTSVASHCRQLYPERLTAPDAGYAEPRQQ